MVMAMLETASLLVSARSVFSVVISVVYHPHFLPVPLIFEVCRPLPLVCLLHSTLRINCKDGLFRFHNSHFSPGNIPCAVAASCRLRLASYCIGSVTATVCVLCELGVILTFHRLFPDDTVFV
uniref:Secreted protein n=1 Tax=Strigamia maritima TaxID=126957 RepID=T1IL90_STRMM